MAESSRSGRRLRSRSGQGGGGGESARRIRRQIVSENLQDRGVGGVGSSSSKRRMEMVAKGCSEDFAHRRKFSILHEDPAVLDRLRAEFCSLESLDDLDGGSMMIDDQKDDQQSTTAAAARQHRRASARTISASNLHHKLLESYSPNKKRRVVHLQSADLFESYSPVQRDRLSYKLEEPAIFLAPPPEEGGGPPPPPPILTFCETEIPNLILHDQDEIAKFLPSIAHQKIIKLVKDEGSALQKMSHEEQLITSSSDGLLYSLTIGIILSGGPAPGGHNVIAGVYDFVKSLSEESRLIGFKGGIDGLVRSDCIEINDELMDQFRNTGGFDMIWSGRGKVTEDELPKIHFVVKDLRLDGLIIVGGDGSNSNAAILADALNGGSGGLLGSGATTGGGNTTTTSGGGITTTDHPIPPPPPPPPPPTGSSDWKCSVIGVPKTIDGDLKNEAIECSFGFDTASKTYSESIGNLCMDCSVGQGVWHFVRVMGRSASHLVMECAMQTRPNLVIIGEEVEQNNISLREIVESIVDLIESRWIEYDRHYGIVLVPEGLIEFIPEFKILIQELSAMDQSALAAAAAAAAAGVAVVDPPGLSERSRDLWKILPADDRQMLMGEREASGYVQVAKIATERLLLYCAEDMLRKRGKIPFKSFNRMHHYFGYEGRCAIPSNFDAEYCYALGKTSAALINLKLTGYMAVVKNLSKAVGDWEPMGVPFTSLMKMVKLAVGLRPGITRQLVDTKSPSFEIFKKARSSWKFDDYYRCPGPIQFYGPVSQLRNFVVNPPSDEYELLAGRKDEDSKLLLIGRAVRPQRLGCYSQLQRERIQHNLTIPDLCIAPTFVAVRGNQHIPQDPYIRTQLCLTLPNVCNDNEFYQREIRPGGVPPPTTHTTAGGTTTSGNTTSGGTTSGGLRSSGGRGLRCGVVFLSRQAPGTQNILWGCYERCKINGGVCFGFKGSEGLLANDYMEITESDLDIFKNLGGSDLIGRGIEHLLMEEKNWHLVEKHVLALQLDGLVLVGSSLAITEASYLAEHFLRRHIKCRVIGVPATASNNIGSDLIEANIGFDTASKLYASLIGNVLTDAASMPKYWHFIRLMGRQPSNEVLECALQTHPNIVIIAEEYGVAQKTLQHVVEDIADIVCRRADSDDCRRNFGAVLIPDGLWHHLPTFRMTMTDLDQVISTATAEGQEKEALEWLLTIDDETTEQPQQNLPTAAAWAENIPPWSLAVWRSLPQYIRQELLSSDKELRFTYVETERLLAQMVSKELERRKGRGEYKGVFQCVCHYFGYQGRSAMPSIFDATLGLVHGYLAIMCIEANITGHLTTIRGLCGKINSWKLGAVPFNCFLTLVPSQQSNNLHPSLAQRERSEQPVVANAEINLQGKAFRWLKIARSTWAMQDRFCNPGPIQFYGIASTYYHRILHEEQAEYSRMLRHAQKYASMLKNTCDFGVDESYLKFVFTTLHGLLFLRNHPDNLVEDIGRIKPRHQVIAAGRSTGNDDEENMSDCSDVSLGPHACSSELLSEI